MIPFKTDLFITDHSEQTTFITDRHQFITDPLITDHVHNVPIHNRRGADPEGGDWVISPLKPTKVTVFIMILCNSQNSIRDIRPFCGKLFCHRSVVKDT